MVLQRIFLAVTIAMFEIFLFAEDVIVFTLDRVKISNYLHENTKLILDIKTLVTAANVLNILEI